MQRILAEEKAHDVKVLLIEFPEDGKIKTATIAKNGEAIHCSVSELFVMKKVIDTACRKLLRETS